MRSQHFAMTTATRLVACSLLIAAVFAISLLVSPHAYAQQGCTQVKMISGDADNTLYLVDGDGRRLRDFRNGNTLSNRQVNSSIVLRGVPSMIGIEIDGTGQILYDYTVSQSGAMGFEDYIDDDFNDAVILLTPVNCPEGVSPPQRVSLPPRGTNPPPVSQAVTVPSIQSVSADNITKTTARAVVNIDDHDGTELTVELRYQVKADEQDWTTDVETADATGTGSPVTKSLAGLTPGTEYVLQASFDATFPDDATEEYTFTTERLTGIQSVSADNITKTTARAVVNIDDHDGTELTVELRYQVKADEQDWTTDVETAEATGTGSPVTKGLADLTPGTEYVLQASLADTFPDDATEEYTFTTERLTGISSVSISNVGRTSARATINIADSDGSTQTAKLQYRTTNPQGQWSAPALEKTSTDAIAVIELSGLTEDTGYEVQAWLAADSTNKKTDTFRTLQTQQQRSQVGQKPSISDLEFENIGQTSVTAMVKITDAGTEMKEVYLKHGLDGTEDWTMLSSPAITYTDRTSIDLTRLQEGTTYEVAAALSDDYSPMVMGSFTTLSAPSLSGINIDDITQTSAAATVTIANAGTSRKMVYLLFRKFGETEWSEARPKTTRGSDVNYDLTSLEPGTTYGVRAYLGTDPGTSKHAVFTTLPLPTPVPPATPEPSVSGVSLGNITQTTAYATVAIANAGTARKTVHLHYRVDGATAWSTVQSSNTNGSSTTISLASLTAGTTYEVQTWLKHTTPPAGTTIYTFDTLPNPPSISDIRFEDIEQTSATAVVTIADAGTSQNTVYHKYRVQGTDDWTTVLFPTITHGDSASIALSGLQEQTVYEVAVALVDDFSSMVTKSFTTLPPPSLSGVSIGSVTQTSAVATVSIANAGSGQKTVLLQYRVFGESNWNVAKSKTIDGASVTYDLQALEPRTTYEVKAYLSVAPDVLEYTVFTTLLPDTSLSGISVGSIGQTTAVATVSIAYPGTAQKTVHLRYRKFGESEWSDAESKTTDGASVSFDLAGLSPKTKYEVDAALNSDFSGSKSATFTTLALEPVVTGVKVNDIAQTSARAVVEIANANGEQQTVRLRYRTTSPQGDWSDTQETTSIATASIDLFALTAGTKYEVEASLDADFGRAESATFTTLRYPSISDLEVRDETKNSATAVITIADPDGSSQTVHLRYRTITPQEDWSGTQKIATATAIGSLELSGLTADTEYEAEVSFTPDFGVSKIAIFRTLPLDPMVAGVNVNSIRQTTATASIDIANTNGDQQTVHLRYRTTTPRGDWSETLATTSSTDSATIGLSGLTPGTKYNVQASLDSSFPTTRTKYTTFTTLRYPGIASFEADNIGRNGATVVATIADSQGEAQTVYVRHRQSRYIAWRTTQHTDSVDDVASLRLRGLSSGTEYIAEASLDSTFPDGETRSVTFTTKERRDDDDDAGGGGVVAQPAHARDAPLPGHSPLTLRFIAVEGGDNPAPQTFSVWNRVYGTMDFVLSNHEEWLTQEPVSGVSSGPGDPVTITASVDSSELAAGQYVDVINIKVSSSGSSPGQVIVVLDVLTPDHIRQFVSRVDGGVVMLPGGAVKIVVPPLAPPKDVDIELMKLNLMAHGIPPGGRERVVVAVDSNTYPPGGDTPEDVAYSPNVELWVMLPAGESDSCVEGRIRVYSVQPGDWSLVEHRCETDEAGNVWAVADIERLGAFALVIDDSPEIPTPTPAASALAPPVTPAVANASSATVRTSLPAQPPTPVPSVVPTPMPVPVRQPAVVPEIMPTPTPTAVPQSEESPVPALQATVETRDSSGGFNGLILGALGLPLLIGGGVVGILFCRERRRNGKQFQ